MSIVADTGVLIDYLAGQERAASRVALELGHGQLKTTAAPRTGRAGTRRRAGRRGTLTA